MKPQAKGSIIIAALFFITLSLTLFAALSEIIFRQIKLRQATISQTNRDNLTRANVTQEILNNPALFPSNNPNIQIFQNTSLSSTLTILSSVDQPQLSLLLSKRSSLNNFPFPNWTALEKDFPQLPCKKFLQHSKNLLSNQSCTKIFLPITKSFYLQGNLTLEDPLIINASNTNLYLVTTGSMILTKPIQMLNSTNLKLILLAAGNIHLNQIQTDSSTNLSLQIYSATGSIQIENPNHQLNFCTTPLEPTQVRTTLQTQKGGKLEKLKLPHSSTSYGCPVEYDPIYWPQNIILGELGE